jgi:lipid-A-disaccharide synthase
MSGVLQRLLASGANIRPVMVLSERMAGIGRQIGLPAEFIVRPNLAEELQRADLAIAKSGTVTLECAYFHVPTLVMYKTSAFTFALAKCIVQVNWVAMPNILANEPVFPEFIQSAATAESIAHAALELLRDPARRNRVKEKLATIVAALGKPGAARRAAKEIIDLLAPQAAVSSVETE